MNDIYKIYLVLYSDDETGELVVSHGIKEDGSVVTLPCEPLRFFSPLWDSGALTWYIEFYD